MADHPYLQSGDYIPRREDPFRSWGQNFASRLQQEPSRYGLTPEEAATIAMWTERYVESHTVGTQPGTRTCITVHTKRALRRTVETLYRQCAQRIKHTPGVSERDLVELGIHIDDSSKTPIRAPRSRPNLMIRMLSNCRHELRYADAETPNRKRKPPGVMLLQLHANVGPTINMDLRTARPLGDFSRQPIRIEWLPEDAGKTVTYFARWVSRKGLKGPWSLPVFMMIACGGQVMSPWSADSRRAA